MTRNLCLLFFFSFLLIAFNSGCSSEDSFAESIDGPTVEEGGLPVDEEGLTFITDYNSDYVVNMLSYRPSISYDNLHNITGKDDNGKGLKLDLNNNALWGRCSTGPYPFEAGDSDYDFPYYRHSDLFTDGIVTINISDFFKTLYDSNSWNKGGNSTATPTIAYRMELFSGASIKGMYGSFASFKKNTDGTFEKLPTILEGPLVTLVCSDNPTIMYIVWRTDEDCTGKVNFGEHTFVDNTYAKTHSIKIDNLTPDTKYEYYVVSESQDSRTVVSNTYNVRTAPSKGKASVKFVYASDSYSSNGGGERDYMGCNMDILRDIAASSYRDEAEFMIFGGDLVDGFAVKKEELILQFRAWKQIMSGFWHTRSVYPGMGNHEFLMNISNTYQAMDRWPYATDSSEAIFAQEFYNPENGPGLSDSRRPTYKENVYHFQYGAVLVMSVNNDYWQSVNYADPTAKTSADLGGSPYGYIMEDQLTWIENKLESAENDSTIKYIFIFTHCPVLPYMKHVADSMWWDGNNNIRAKSRKLNQNSGEYEIQAEPLGILEVRDRMLTAVTTSTKVAAIFTSHEHGYHRTLISKFTPIGVYPDDDTNGDGILDKYSSNSGFTNATWHIMCGGGGSGFNAEDDGATPWKPQRSTSHTGYVLIEASEDKVGMKFIGGLSREVMDELDDLMAVKSQ